MVGNASVGKTIVLEVLRDGDLIEISVTLGRRETAEAALAGSAEAEESKENEEQDFLGITLIEDISAKGLLVVDVLKTSDAAQKGIRVGDILVEAGQTPVKSFEDFESRIAEAIEAGRTSLLVLVRRDGSPRFIPLSLE